MATSTTISPVLQRKRSAASRGRGVVLRHVRRDPITPSARTRPKLRHAPPTASGTSGERDAGPGPGRGVVGPSDESFTSRSTTREGTALRAFGRPRRRPDAFRVELGRRGDARRGRRAPFPVARGFRARARWTPRSRRASARRRHRALRLLPEHHLPRARAQLHRLLPEQRAHHAHAQHQRRARGSDKPTSSRLEGGHRRVPPGARWARPRRPARRPAIPPRRRRAVTKHRRPISIRPRRTKRAPSFLAGGTADLRVRSRRSSQNA